MEETNKNVTVTSQFPHLNHFSISNQTNTQSSNNQEKNEADSCITMTLTGENFTHDLQIWFGDIKAPFTEFKDREKLICRLPSHKELMQSAGLNRVHDIDIQEDDKARKQKLPFGIKILLVRGDGVVYKTNKSYYFQ